MIEIVTQQEPNKSVRRTEHLAFILVSLSFCAAPTSLANAETTDQATEAQIGGDINITRAASQADVAEKGETNPVTDLTIQQNQQLDGREGRELLLRNFRPNSQLK